MNRTGTETGPARAVQIGEMEVAGEGRLRATLGSCVGIVVMSRKAAVCGLAHCLLPAGPEEGVSRDARYVESAVENLLRAMGVEDRAVHPRRHLRAYLAGGARVVGELSRPGRPGIGELNLEAARRVLREGGIEFEELETGGEVGCILEIDCERQAVTCRRLQAMDWRRAGRLDRRTV